MCTIPYSANIHVAGCTHPTPLGTTTDRSWRTSDMITSIYFLAPASTIADLGVSVQPLSRQGILDWSMSGQRSLVLCAV